MSRLRLVLRQIRADWPVVLLLAAVLTLGSVVTAAAPGWVDTKLDVALRERLTEAGRRTELSARARFGAPDPDVRDPLLFQSPTAVEDVIPGLLADEPRLASIYGQPRWAVSLSGLNLRSHNGEPENPRQPRIVNVRMPADLAEHVRVTEGELPDADVVLTPVSISGGDRTVNALRIEVAALSEVAESLRLTVGDEALLKHERSGSAQSVYVKLLLTGVVEPIDDRAALWTDAQTVVTPDLGAPGDDPRITRGTVLARPETTRALADPLLWKGVSPHPAHLAAEWHLTLRPDRLRADDLPTLTEVLARTEFGRNPRPTWRSSLDTVLEQYAVSRSSAERTAALGALSLGALVVILLALTIRLVAERRSEALMLARVRGGGVRTLVQLLLMEAAAVGVPAVTAGAVAAYLLVGNPWQGASTVLPAGLLAVVLAGLPAIGTQVARQGATTRPESAVLRPSHRRLTTEAGIVILAAAGLWLLANRSSTESDTGIDPVTSVVPVLAATAAGLVTVRLAPYLVSALVRATRRGRGLVAFLVAARSARAPGSATLPLVGVVIAVGLAAFGSTIDATVRRAHEVSSWQAVTADVAVETSTLRVTATELPDLVPQANAVAAGYLAPSQRLIDHRGRGVAVDILVVDISAWERVVETAPEPVEPVATLASAEPDGDEVAAVVTSGTELAVGDQVRGEVRGTGLTAEVVGKTTTIPGVGTAPTLVLPASSVSGGFGLTWPTVVYLSGDLSADDVSALDGDVTSRARILADRQDDPVLAATQEVFRIAVVVGALLAAASAVLTLLVTARSRGHTLSILRTLGLTSRQATALVTAEAVPSSIVASLVGGLVGMGTALLAVPAVELTARRGTLPDAQVVLDLPGTTAAAAMVLAVIVMAVAVMVAVSRRARLGDRLRAGEMR